MVPPSYNQEYNNIIIISSSLVWQHTLNNVYINYSFLECLLQLSTKPRPILSSTSSIIVWRMNSVTVSLWILNCQTFTTVCHINNLYTDPVWKVARYTSAAPMFLKECDNYVDGGVICNNPTDCGLTVIQNFYRKQGMKPPIALVVSIGSGRYPPEKIGKVDAQAFLYFGKRWLQIDKLVKRTQNLLTLLNQAVSTALFIGQ